MTAPTLTAAQERALRFYAAPHGPAREAIGMPRRDVIDRLADAGLIEPEPDSFAHRLTDRGRAALAPRCVMVSGRRRAYQCTAPGTETHGGEPYCSTHAGYMRQHHPEQATPEQAPGATVCDREDCQQHPEVILTDNATGAAVTHSESHAWALLDVPAGSVTVERAPEPASDVPAGMVAVAVSCSYACGRDWEDVVTLPAPPEGAAGSAVDEHRGGPWQLADWWDDVVRPRMGDGHRCGPRTCESYDEAVIRSAPGRPELADRGQTWQG